MSASNELLGSAATVNRTALMAIRETAFSWSGYYDRNPDHYGGANHRQNRELVAIAEEHLQDWPSYAFCPII